MVSVSISSQDPKDFLSKLPDPLLNHVFSYLSPLDRLPLNRRFVKFLSELKVYKITEIFVIQLAKWGAHLKRLSIESSAQYPITVDVLKALADNLRYLESVQIDCSCSDFGLPLSYFAASCKRLVRLEISHLEDLRDSQIEELSISCPQLTVFSLKGSSEISERGILQACRNWPRLEALSLDRISLGFLSSLGKTCIALRFLQLSGDWSETDAEVILQRFSKLKVLVLDKQVVSHQLSVDLEERGIQLILK